MQSNAEVAEYQSSLSSYTSNKIPSKDTLLQSGNAACRIYRSDNQQLKITAQYRMTNLYIQASFPVPYNLFLRLQFHYHSWAIKTLKMQAPCETVSHEIYRPAVRYQRASEFGFR